MLKLGGLKPWYLQECSSTLATTYSSGTLGQDCCIPDLILNVETGRAEALVPTGVQLHPGHHLQQRYPWPGRCIPDLILSFETGRAEALVPGGVQLHSGHHLQQRYPCPGPLYP